LYVVSLIAFLPQNIDFRPQLVTQRIDSIILLAPLLALLLPFRTRPFDIALFELGALAHALFGETAVAQIAIIEILAHGAIAFRNIFFTSSRAAVLAAVRAAALARSCKSAIAAGRTSTGSVA
jgi:hypothetical protein